MITLAEIIEELDNIAPPELADDDDRIGLQVGNRQQEIRRVCVSVDTSPDIIELAASKKADLLVSHHPLIYTPLRSISLDDSVAKRVVKLVKEDISLYVMHTNYDTVPGGINDILADKLVVRDCVPLTSRKQDSLYKIVVFVPEEAVEDVRNAMAEAGAGRIGQYTHCSFRTKGTGSFVPLSSAQPYIGTPGTLEEVDEYRLEMICVGSWLNYVLEAMIDKHPYEEVAYDVYELMNEPIIYGFGRVGMLDEEVSLAEFSELVKLALELEYVKVAGNPQKRIRRVALCGGGGSSFFREAARLGADVYVTGDTKHHDLLDANAIGLAMIDAGHFATEKPGMIALADRLKRLYRDESLEIEYIE